MRTIKRRRNKTCKCRRNQQKGGQALKIQYPTASVNGQDLTAKETARRPIVSIPKGHYIIMYDSNAIKPDYIHWMASSNMELLPYQGPSPPKGSGTHRYGFVLCKGVSPAPPVNRFGQNAQSFIKNPIIEISFYVKS
jgi:phosphatidylethanolamine-binding protein (PEBP) family uncharacterized protein